MKRVLFSVLSLALLAWTAAPVSATKLQHRNIDHMSKLADRVFVGICTTAGPDEAPLAEGVTMKSTRYTFDVIESIKGNLGATLEIRHLGNTEGVGVVPGMPVYRPGGKYVIFLLPDSDIGLCSPVGLFQGAFEVGGDPAGAPESATVLNANNNVGVFYNMERRIDVTPLSPKQVSMVRQTRGAYDYRSFVNYVRELVN
jgi:hypothetical protein